MTLLLVLCFAAAVAAAGEEAANLQPVPADVPADTAAVEATTQDQPAADLGDGTPTLMERETLTNNWFGLGDELAESGITVSLGLTQVYQINLNGGASTSDHSGRFAGSYDLEINADMEKLLDVSGGKLYVHAEGSCSNGLNGSAFANFGVNADAAGDRVIDVTELWYQQNLLEDRLRIRVGKIDLTGGFDCRGCPVAFDTNRFAGDETTQFLNGGLVNNQIIPFPQNGLGAIVYLEPMDGFYLAAGAADAQADVRETGFSTAFHGEDYFFGIFETGVAVELDSDNGPLQGTYRAGLWYDGAPRPNLNTAVRVMPLRWMYSETARDDVGFYVSVDQMVMRESDQDDQGLGVFARYGYAHGKTHFITHFWSVGGQYTGLIPTRDADVMGLGIARGLWRGGLDIQTSNATEMELYYNIVLTPWLSVAPSVQYIFNPGQGHLGDATVIGIRAQLSL